jgi:predicted ATPase
MFLRELRVKNYMVHQDTTVTLEPLTVFVGPNGGGKSALFDALLNFSMLSRGNLRQAFGPYPYSFKSTIYRGASKVSKIGYRVVMSRNREDAGSLEYEIDYAQTGQNEDHPQFVVNREILVEHPSKQIIFDRNDPEQYPIARSVVLENDRSLLAAVRYSQSQGSEVETSCWCIALNR